MTTAVFRAVAQIDPTDSHYALGYRYVVATAQVTIPGGVLTTINAAAGGAASGACTLDSLVYTVAKVLSDGDAASAVIGTATPASSETVSFYSVSRSRTDGFRLAAFTKSLTPTGAPSVLSFRFVSYGLFGTVFIPGGEEISDGALTGPGGLKGLYWNNIDRIGTPAVTVTENINVTGSTSVGGVNMSLFSARWAGFIKADETGPHRFVFGLDNDGSILFDEVSYLTIGPNATGYFPGPFVNLVAGQYYKIIVTMVNYGGPWLSVLYWQKPSAPGVSVVVPASVMYYGASQSIPAPSAPRASHYVQSVTRYLEA